MDLEAEQEVDLGRYWSAIVAHWWLPLAGLLVGALIGYLISLGGSQVWKASSTVFIGAPYSVVGGILLQGPQANPSTVGTIVRSEDSIQRAATQAGMRAGDLRGHVSTKTISSGTGAGTVRTSREPARSDHRAGAHQAEKRRSPRTRWHGSSWGGSRRTRIARSRR